ncbi:MAG: O-antigen ligase family protein [Bacteroidota bacterium]|nr:O-antigen ligase family protein [Bacteroidota bacterium]
MLIVFLTPLSVNLANKDFNVGLSLPSEPLMFGALLLFTFKLLYNKNFDDKIVKHPVTIAIIFSLFWTFITSITSEMPMVSFKFLISRLWFIIPFYFVGTQMFRNYKNIDRFYWLSIIPISMVVLYTVYNHAQYDFEHKPAHWVMSPFYNDHTSYGAVLAMFFPAFFLFLKDNYSKTVKFFAGFLMLVFIVGIVFSYTRAAWLSLAVAAALGAVYLLKIRLVTLIIITVAVLSLFFAFKSDLVKMLEKNRQDSSNNLTEHVQSMSNVSSDASNLERINRWQSAMRMFEDKPVFGWGPGTYAFQYAPYQNSKEKTIISTNAGDAGNAHSEYIGPLAEQGVIGMLAFIAIILCVYYKSSLLYIRLKDKKKKTLVLVTLLGFTTYVVHGFLNNFLDTDKAAVPFWGFLAILTAMDIYHSEEDERQLPVAAAKD